jgi:hypothetical protein
MVALAEEKDEAYVMVLIEDLAMSRSNSLSAKKRGDQVKLVEQFLSENPGSRRALAEIESTFLILFVHADYFPHNIFRLTLQLHADLRMSTVRHSLQFKRGV